jgi:hypothetical protein
MLRTPLLLLVCAFAHAQITYGQATLPQFDWHTQIKNKPFLDVQEYQFSRTSGSGVSGTLTSSGAGKVLTFTSGPKGIMYSSAVPNYLYITGGTGTAEAALITATTCSIAGDAACTVTVTTANTHSGSWSVTSANFGAQEAINAAINAGGGTVTIPPGTYNNFYATIRIYANSINLQGAGIYGTIINRTGDFGDSIRVDSSTAGATLRNVNISDLAIYQTVNYTAGSPPTVVNKPTTGAHIKFQNCAYCSVHDTEVMWMPYGIDLDTVGWTRIYNNTIKSVWDYANAGVQIGIAGIYLHHSESGAGFPTYLWVENNVILGPGSVARNITVNGNTVNLVEPVGPKDGVLVESCELCWIRGNSIEWQDSNGINIKAAAPHSVADALLVIDISNNYIDRNRSNGILFDMSADELARFALGTTIHDNWILGSGATINLIKFAGAAAPPTYVRVAQETLISNNVLRFGLGSAIFMLGGTNTKITGNVIHGYNELNSYPLNTLSCSGVSGVCTGDRMGNSGIFMTEAALGTTVTGNVIGGNYLGTSYAGGAFTVNGVTIGSLIYQSANEGDTITAPNSDGGVQAPSARSVAAAYDPAFFNPPGPIRGAARSSVAVSGCGSLSANATILSGFITSATSGTCTPVLTFTTAVAANGWACHIDNRTTANMIRQTASTTGSATFSGTTVSGDVLSYSCTAF